MSTRYYKYKTYPSVVDFYKRGEDPEAPPVPEGARRITGGTSPFPRPDFNELIRRITGGGVDVEPEEEGEGPRPRPARGAETEVGAPSLEGEGGEEGEEGEGAGGVLGNLDSKTVLLIGLGVGGLILLAMVFSNVSKVKGKK